MNRTGIPYLDFTWNPFGFGCSKGCPGCWAARSAPRVGKNIGCPDCAVFRPHEHPERLGDPAKRQKPTTIGVQFTGDLFDESRFATACIDVLEAAAATPHHTYVFLTQQISIMAGWFTRGTYWLETRSAMGLLPANGRLPDNWYIGATVKTANDIVETITRLGCTRGHLWLSLEPLQTRMPHLGDWLMDWPPIRGIVIGCDNRYTNQYGETIPWDNAWASDIVEQCDAACVCVYVKQIRDKAGRLLTDPACFPPDLRRRKLPWPLYTKEP